MASLLDWAKKKVDAAYHGISPFDNGQGWTSQAPQQPQQQPQQAPVQPHFSFTNNPLTRGLSRTYDQINPLDSGRTWQQTAPTLAHTKQSALNQLTHGGIPNATGSFINNITGIPSIIDAGRLGVAELTKNQPAIDSATTSLAKNLPRVIPIGAAENFKNGFGQSIATASTNWYAERLAKQEADRARQELNNNTNNPIHNMQVEAYASAVENDLLNQHLNTAGIDQSTPTNTVRRKIAGQAAQTGADIIFNSQMGNSALTGKFGAPINNALSTPIVQKAGGSLVKDIVGGGALMGTSGAAGVASMDNPTGMDYVKGIGLGVAQGVGLPLLMHGVNTLANKGQQAVAGKTNESPELYNAKQNLQMVEQLAKKDNSVPVLKRLADRRVELKKQITDLQNEQGGGVKNPLYKEDPQAALKKEALKYKSADEFVNSQVSRPKTTDNVWQDTLPSGTRPDSIKKVTKSGGNPLYHDTTADGVLGILDSGEIKASQAPFSSIAGQGKRVSTTRNFDNYSRYSKSPYRLVIDESKTGQRAIPDNREEFESIFRKGVSTKAVNSIAIDTTNPALLDDIRSGKLKNVIESAKKKGVTIEPFEGKVLPNEGANAEVQTMTSRAFSEAFPEYKTRISQLTDLYNQAHTEAPQVGKNQGGYIAPGQIASDIKNKINKIKNTYSFDQTGAIGKDVRPKDIPIVGAKQSSFAKGVTKSNEISPELQAKVKAQDTTYIPTSNADQIKASKTLVNKGYKKAATDVTSRLEVKTGKINAQDVADTIHVIKALDRRGGDANLQQATHLSERLSEHLTKQGQSIQAASILNNRTPEGMAYGARKFLKSHNIEVTPEIQKVIKSHVDEIAKLKPGEARNYKIAELQQKISTYVPSTTAEKAIGLWKAGLLTGIKTQTGNTLSGIATNVLKTASDAPAAALDTGFSALGKTKFGKAIGFTGERSKAFTLRGKASGTVEGAKKGWTSLKTGIDERNIEANKFDTKRLVFSDKPLGRAAQKYTDTVYGMMGAADRPNFYSNLRNNLYDLAITDAKNKGLKGAQRETHIQKYIKEPPMKALETANKAAEAAIFANDTQLSKWAGSLRKAAEGNSVANAGVNVMMPFTKVPSSVAMRLVDYSPIGAIKTIGEQIKNVKKTGKIDQRALSEGLAQSGIGTGTMWLGAQLHQNGLMTGAYPTDQKEQELWKLEGKQPNSIKVGGKWQSINYTSPIGQVLAVGAKVDEAKQSGQSFGGQAAAGAFAIPKTVSDQSFLQGVQGVQDAINDPAHFAPKLAKSQASSIVPTIVSDVAKATDPLQRQSNSIEDAIQAKIPGFNQKLLPKQDAFGQNLTRQSNSVNTLTNPFRPSDVKPTNDLNTELRRLQDQKLGVMPNSTDKQLVFGKQTVNLTPQQLFDKNSTAGKKVQDTWNTIIQTSEYKAMTDEQKQKALRNSLSDINALSKNEFAAKNKPELLDSQKLSKGQIKLSSGDASNYLKTSTTTKTTVSQDKTNNDYKVAKSNTDLTLSRAKTAGDVNIWLDNAAKQYAAIENYKNTLDPNKDQVQINSLSKQQDTLKNNAIKYKSQGGFTKPKKAKTSKGSKASAGAGLRGARGFKKIATPKIRIGKMAKLSVKKLPKLKSIA